MFRYVYLFWRNRAPRPVCRQGREPHNAILFLYARELYARSSRNTNVTHRSRTL